MSKHYVRVEDSVVIKGFSDDFESPLDTDIFLHHGSRHFELDGVVNPPLVNEYGVHIYRYDTDLRKATEEEMSLEYSQLYPVKVISDEDITLELLADHEYRICMLELG